MHHFDQISTAHISTVNTEWFTFKSEVFIQHCAEIKWGETAYRDYGCRLQVLLGWNRNMKLMGRKPNVGAYDQGEEKTVCWV